MREGPRFCGRCGQQLKPAARFCANCGNSVPQSAGQAPAPDRGPDPGAGPRPGPPPPMPPGAAPPRPRPPAGETRRRGFPWPLAVVLAVLVAAGGGTAAALFLTRHSGGQPSGGQQNVAAVTPTTAAPPPVTQTPTSVSPAPPPTQVTINGMTVGIEAVNTDADATGVAATMAAYFGGINTRDYQQAWETYAPALQAAVPLQPFASALSTSQDSQVTVSSIQHDSNGHLDADVSFQSHQAGQYGPNPGETCTNWTLDYHLVPASGASAGTVSLSYQISKVTDIGPGHTSC